MTAAQAPATAPTPGRFGEFGGIYVPETLLTPVLDLAVAYDEARRDPSFAADLDRELREFAGRPTPLLLASRFAEAAGLARVYLKREDLLHTGAHKINNAIGQALLARRMGKSRVIAETGAGQHGVAAATACARYGLTCVVYMGEIDMERQRPNVDRMRLLGAEVRGVSSGSRTLKDAINEAMRDWSANVRSTHYLLGSVLGPHPYPTMVRDFQSVIGRETRGQVLAAEHRLPDLLVACVGGGSNSIGLFHEFLGDATVAMVGVEAGGEGIATQAPRGTVRGASNRRAPRDAIARPSGRGGAGARDPLDLSGARLPGGGSGACGARRVGPGTVPLRHRPRGAWARSTFWPAREGILPALESSHALAWVLREGKRGTIARDALVVANLSGRGDKDLGIVSKFKRPREEGIS